MIDLHCKDNNIGPSLVLLMGSSISIIIYHIPGVQFESVEIVVYKDTILKLHVEFDLKALKGCMQGNVLNLYYHVQI